MNTFRRMLLCFFEVTLWSLKAIIIIIIAVEVAPIFVLFNITLIITI